MHLRAEKGKILLLEVRGYIIVATAEVTHDGHSPSCADVFVKLGTCLFMEEEDSQIVGKKADL